jgi:hypothetical protein
MPQLFTKQGQEERFVIVSTADCHFKKQINEHTSMFKHT